MENHKRSWSRALWKSVRNESNGLERFRTGSFSLARLLHQSALERKSDADIAGHMWEKDATFSALVPETSSSHELVDNSLAPLGPFHLRATSTMLREFNYPVAATTSVMRDERDDGHLAGRDPMLLVPVPLVRLWFQIYARRKQSGFEDSWVIFIRSFVLFINAFASNIFEHTKEINKAMQYIFSRFLYIQIFRGCINILHVICHKKHLSSHF